LGKACELSACRTRWTAKRSKAEYKNGVLTVKLPKRSRKAEDDQRRSRGVIRISGWIEGAVSSLTYAFFVALGPIVTARRDGEGEASDSGTGFV
jgi:hypothetical protein